MFLMGIFFVLASLIYLLLPKLVIDYSIYYQRVMLKFSFKIRKKHTLLIRLYGLIILGIGLILIFINNN